MMLINENTNISVLTAEIAENPDAPPKFYFDGTAINPGYHVTEIRHASINSMDCERNSEADKWDEITVQLLNGSDNALWNETN